jgi:hypothetical protein
MSGEATGAVAGTLVRVRGALEELSEMRREIETEFPSETELLHDVVHLESQATHLLWSLVLPPTSH